MTDEGFFSLQNTAGKFAQPGEYPAQTLRRALLSGELSERELLKFRGVGRKGISHLLDLLGLERSDQIIQERRV